MSSKEGEETAADTTTDSPPHRHLLDRKRKAPSDEENQIDNATDAKRLTTSADIGETANSQIITPPKLLPSNIGLAQKPESSHVQNSNPKVARGFESLGGDSSRSFDAAKSFPLKSSPPLTSSLFSQPSNLPTFPSSFSKEGKSENLFLHFVKGASASNEKSSEEKVKESDGSSHIETVEKETKGGFVFGSNLSDRVIVSCPSTTPLDTKCKTAAAETSATSEDHESQTSDSAQEESRLNEPEILFQSKSAPKPLLSPTESEVMTGEEKEKTVLQIFCILYMFDAKSHSWIEKGRGMLHLNDMDKKSSQSRIVMRAQGNLRVILNTLIWSQMACETVGRKSLRLTALNSDGGICVCLVKCALKDCETLYLAIKKRLEKIKAENADKMSSECTEENSSINKEASSPLDRDDVSTKAGTKDGADNDK